MTKAVATMKPMQPAQSPQRAAVTIVQCLESETWKREVSLVLPQYLTADLFFRVSRTVAKQPKFAACTPESFFEALIKCGRAGLVPDGRNAHLIPFGKEVQCIFDWKGLVAMAKRNGVEVTPKLVHEEDQFEVEEDDGTGVTRVKHRVDFTKARGEIVLVYSRAKTIASGEVDYEFMTREEVEAIRQNFSKAKDSLMWLQAWGEGAKKTVIRRHSKRWDLSPEDRANINGDDDTLPVEVTSTVAPAKPLFAKPAEPERLEDAEQSPPAEPEPGTAAAAVKQVFPEAEANGKPLKQVRNLCKMGGIKEGKLLEVLHTIGQTDGSFGSLEDLAMSKESVLVWTGEHWPEVIEKLRA